MTLVAFTLNVLLPFLVLYTIPSSALALGLPETAQTQNRPADVLSPRDDQVLICTPEGVKWVSVSELDTDGDEPSGKGQIVCPICYTAAHGSQHILSPGLVYAVVVRTSKFVHPEIAYTTPTYRRHYRAFLSRAPPQSA